MLVEHLQLVGDVDWLSTVALGGRLLLLDLAVEVAVEFLWREVPHVHLLRVGGVHLRGVLVLRALQHRRLPLHCVR